MLELDPPKGLGFIVRTAGIDRTKRELSRDLAYLLRLWKVIVRRIKKHPGPVDIYEESDMIIRTIRDIFTAEVDTIWIDEPVGLRAGQGVLADRHAPLRQPLATVRRPRAAVPQVSARSRDRPDPAAQGAAAARGLDRDRSDRSPGGHRRQQRQLPGRRLRRGNRLPDESAGGQGDRPATAAARFGRRGRQRLHRHAQGAASPRTSNARCATR